MIDLFNCQVTTFYGWAYMILFRWISAMEKFLYDAKPTLLKDIPIDTP